MGTSVSLSTDFLQAFSALPKSIQSKTHSFMKKFMENPRSPGIHLEKLNSQDGQFHSARIDQAYRAIICRDDASSCYILLWVDHHDAAYDWASKRKCAVNRITGTVQLYSTVDSSSSNSIDTPTGEVGNEGLFSALRDDSLLELGVPEELLASVRALSSNEEFYDSKVWLPADCFENLSWIAGGFELDEVLDLVRSQRGEPIGDPEGFQSALSSPDSQRSFVVLSGEEELEMVLSSPLENWRVFLHPSQRALVEREFRGPARVLGSAGTGKTVVALHRARHLASELDGSERLLFTTFSTTLASDIKANLMKICDRRTQNYIEVANLDSWVASFLGKHKIGYSLEYDEEKLLKLWNRAIEKSGTMLDFDARFYFDEWRHVIVAMPELSLAMYTGANRAGRGKRLSRRDRLEVWRVVDCYRDLMSEYRRYDPDSAMRIAASMLEDPTNATSYKHVVVDEGQDFPPVAYKLIRAIAGKQHSNDIFIVGDPQQRIYGRAAVLSRCGIEVRGRSSILRINYRTTEQIRTRASAVLKGIEFDDLDGCLLDDHISQSLTQGAIPRIVKCESAADEVRFTADTLRGFEQRGGDLREVCVMVRTNRLVEELCARLKDEGIRFYKLRNSKTDDQAVEGVRVATMHRVKGLEFDTVMLACVGDGYMPPRGALADAREKGQVEQLEKAERSLLYVAMTRAKRELVVTYVGSCSLIAEPR